MRLLGVDFGTTHCKAGIFDERGEAVALSSRPTPTRHTAEGFAYYDPDELWAAVAAVMREAVAASGAPVEAIGVASMGEAGLLIEPDTGRARSHVLPWYDRRADAQAERIGRQQPLPLLFRRTGLHPNFKQGLSKLLWLRDQDPGVTEGAVWLSVGDYVVYRLTGQMVTDPTLAARTYLYNVGEGSWDEEWMARFGLEPSLFPPILPSGYPAGSVTHKAARDSGVPPGTPAAVGGHDHLCALLPAGVIAPGPVLDSMGTAEALLGTMPEFRAGESELATGLSLGPHILPGRFVWVGGLPASGGSVEWLRGQLGAEPLSYDRLGQLLADMSPGPSEILYFPYLAGSGAPEPDQLVRGAFVGLSADHGQTDLLQAVLEGTGYEMEGMRRAGEVMTGQPITDVIVVGGGARIRHWVQIKANISGCRYVIPDLPEATLLGAALAAAVGAGILGGDQIEGIAQRRREAGTTVVPETDIHRRYRYLYETGYLAMQEPLRGLARRLRARQAVAAGT